MPETLKLKTFTIIIHKYTFKNIDHLRNTMNKLNLVKILLHFIILIYLTYLRFVIIHLFQKLLYFLLKNLFIGKAIKSIIILANELLYDICK